MTAAVPSEMNHPTDETLAAFADATLSDAERQEVMKHLAECADCLEAVMWTTEMKAVEEPVAGNVVSAPFGWKRIVPLAAAASLVIVLGLPQTRERLGFGPMREVTKFARSLEERPSDARLSFDAEHKPATQRLRGGAKPGDPTTVYRADEAQALAEEKPTVANLHAAGTMLMLANKHHEAVGYLQRAAKAAGDPSAALLTDLAAAYLEAGDYRAALATAERAWRKEQTPVTAWNRALALQRVGTNDRAAKDAWETYLKMDGSSPWADEVRNVRLPELQ